MIDLLLAKMGIKPDELKARVEQAQSDFKAIVTHFNERLNTIDVTQSTIIENQEIITDLLRRLDHDASIGGNGEQVAASAIRKSVSVQPLSLPSNSFLGV